MKSKLGKIALVFMAAVLLMACGGGGGGGGSATPSPTATPTPTPAPATNVTINSINSETCDAAVAYVTVTNEYNELVMGLVESDFTLFVDGSEVDPTAFAFIDCANTDVSVSFVMDYSRSAIETLDAMKQAVINFIEAMDPEDEGEVIRFAGTSEVTQLFTTDKDLMIAAINSDFPDQSNTNIFSPLVTAVTDASDEARTGRGAVIIFTDGFHNYNTYPTPTADDVIDLASTNGIPIFVIGYMSERDDDRIASDRAVLQRLAEETGGVYLEATSTDSFEDLYAQMADLIQNQYQITFDGTGGTELQIRVNNGGVTGQSEIEDYLCDI